MVKINDIERPDYIDPSTIELLDFCGNISDNPVVTITSGIRSPLRQANAMYDNLIKGNRIRYTSPGMEVTKVFDDNKVKDKKTVIGLMVDKINKLANEGKRVSKHCVPWEIYIKNNIIDITKYLPNPRDFVKALEKEDRVTKVITPFSSNYGKKVSVDANEGAIHVEIVVLD